MPLLLIHSMRGKFMDMILSEFDFLDAGEVDDVRAVAW